MKLFAPSYYKEFRCIAGECKHSCCIGWEIDIDDDTYAYYSAIKDDFGKRLIENISLDGEVPHFSLDEEEKCPFLNNSGLCDIIITLGENKLCQICTDHPRYRNYFKDRIEIGLGLCCESAARLILSQTDKINIIALSSNEYEEVLPENDNEFFVYRENIFNILQERNVTIAKRLKKILLQYGLNFFEQPLSKFINLFLSLEYMEGNLKALFKRLENKKTFSKKFTNDFEIVFEQIAVYFIYRHIAEGIYDGMMKERVTFAILSTVLLNEICILKKSDYGVVSFDDLMEFSRLYSAEIEYSEENLRAILDNLSE